MPIKVLVDAIVFFRHRTIFLRIFCSIGASFHRRVVGRGIRHLWLHRCSFSELTSNSNQHSPSIHRNDQSSPIATSFPLLVCFSLFLVDHWSVGERIHSSTTGHVLGLSAQFLVGGTNDRLHPLFVFVIHHRCDIRISSSVRSSLTHVMMDSDPKPSLISVSSVTLVSCQSKNIFSQKICFHGLLSPVRRCHGFSGRDDRFSLRCRQYFSKIMRSHASNI